MKKALLLSDEQLPTPTLYFLLLLAVSWSCRSINPALAPDPIDYFALETGHYTIYDVAEQRYSFTATSVSLTYQLKEVIGPAYQDVTNQLAYRLLRYRRTTAGQSWQLDSIWSTRQTLTEAIRTENNRDIIKLTFPIIENARWNANRYTTAAPDEYELRNVGQPFSVSGMTFDHTVTVWQQADSTLVGQDKRREVYAQSVGLIYRESIQLQFCTTTPDCIGKNQVVYGTQKTYRIRSYGNE